jgi:hypothetical protein
VAFHQASFDGFCIRIVLFGDRGNAVYLPDFSSRGALM